MQFSKVGAPIHLLRLNNSVQPAELEALAPQGEILACDFYVAGAETFEEVPWGFRQGRLTNIDHHAPVPRMARRISSGNLAMRRVQELGVAAPTAHLVINHTDCDSVISCALVAGDLEALPELGAAVLAADHTGEANPLADLLQALDPHRDYALSLRNLRLLLEGRALEPAAQQALGQRMRKRELAAALVAQQRFTQVGALAYAVLEESVDGEFFPPLLPEAAAILIFSPRAEAGRSNIKLRLGHAAADGLSLHDLHLAQFDAGYGGRWNAGSNKRGGGTALAPEVYAAEAAACLQRAQHELQRKQAAGAA